MALPTPTIAPVVAGAIPQGRTSYLFVPTVGNLAAPTVAELTAGTDYKNQIASVTGFAPQGSTIDQPNAGSRQIPNIPGPFSLGDGTVVFNLSKTGTADARTVFNDGTDGVSTQTAGYWYFLYEGLVTSGKMRGFQCTVTSAVPSTDIATAFIMTVMFSLQNATGIISVPNV
jgi:hypothetical protein